MLRPKESEACYFRAINAMKHMLCSPSNVKTTVVDRSLAQLSTCQVAYPEAGVSFCRFLVPIDVRHCFGSLPVSVEERTVGVFISECST